MTPPPENLSTLRQRVAPALGDDFLAILASVARGAKLPTASDVDALAPALATLSARYNGLPEPVAASPAMLLAARLAFSFPRDVPKSGAAIAELIAANAVPRAKELSILDLGAGLGATTWGVVRALAASGDDRTVRAELIDDDRDALDFAKTIAVKRKAEGPMRVHVETRVADTTEWVHGGDRKHDLVLIGQSISEMHRKLSPTQRVEQHTALLLRILERRLFDGGALIVVEPALKARSRHLHELRNALVKAGKRVFAPCLHDDPCPALGKENDWCHEDAPIDLPEAIVPLARAAGLRYERLSFSYLILRRDGVALRDRLPNGVLRVVSPPLISKGKRELLLCAPKEPALLRVARLDREKQPPIAFEEAGRGDPLTIEPPLDRAKPRVTSAHVVSRPVLSPEPTDAEP